MDLLLLRVGSKSEKRDINRRSKCLPDKMTCLSGKQDSLTHLYGALM